MKQAKKAIVPPRSIDDSVWYEIKITDWSWPYSFGLRATRYESGPYSEYRSVNLIGELLAPKNIKAKSVRLVLAPQPWMNESERSRHTPSAVGSIEVYRGAFDVHLPFPNEDLVPLLTTVAAGRIKYASLEGSRLRYGKADVRHFRFDVMSDHDPDAEHEYKA